MRNNCFCNKIILIILFAFSYTLAGTTGKIIGVVTDGESGEPLPGTNVYIDGMPLGAASDLDGFYIINNVRPGSYTVVFESVGYQTQKSTNVKVSVDFTTKLDVVLSSQILEGETIVVEAEAPLVRRDLTSSQVAISSEQIEQLPVENINQILSLQAGITRGAGGELHIRGGRSNEIGYTVNGVSIVNPYDNSRSVDVAKNASFYAGDYVSNRDDVFTNISEIDPVNNYTGELTFSGPITDYAAFFVSGRYENHGGRYYGIRQHNPTDSVYKNPLDPNDIQITATGDGAIVPMNASEELSTTLKLTLKPWSNFKFNYDLME